MSLRSSGPQHSRSLRRYERPRNPPGRFAYRRSRSRSGGAQPPARSRSRRRGGSGHRRHGRGIEIIRQLRAPPACTRFMRFPSGRAYAGPDDAPAARLFHGPAARPAEADRRSAQVPGLRPAPREGGIRRAAWCGPPRRFERGGRLQLVRRAVKSARPGRDRRAAAPGEFGLSAGTRLCVDSWWNGASPRARQLSNTG
jgi:hypothetical protein